MVASPNYVIGVNDADQSTFPAPVDVPPGSTAIEDVMTDYFDSSDQPWIDSAFDGRVDYWEFIRAGIPASGLFTGAEAVMTADEAALFGGVAGAPYDPNYHKPGDDITNVSLEALGITVPAIAYVTAVLADDTWTVNGALRPTATTLQLTRREGRPRRQAGAGRGDGRGRDRRGPCEFRRGSLAFSAAARCTTGRRA